MNLKQLSKKNIVILAIALITILLSIIAIVSNSKKIHSQSQIAYLKSKDALYIRRYEDAIKYIDQAIIHDKKNTDYYFFKAGILEKQAKYHEAKLYIYRALKINPKKPELWHRAGKLEFLTGDAYKGETLIGKAIKLAPANSDYKYDLALYLWDVSRNRTKAIFVLEDLLKHDPDYYDAWNQLAAYYYYSNNDEKSNEIRKRSVEQFPENAFLWFWLGVNSERLHKTEEALVAYKKSIDLEPLSGKEAALRISELTHKPVDPKYRDPEPHKEELPFVSVGNTMYVRAKINGVESNFLVDTGASYSGVYKFFIDAKGLKIGDTPFRVEVQTGSGVIQAPIFSSKFELAGYKLSSVRTMILPDPETKFYAGIIGQNILKTFNMQIDNANQKLILKR